MALRGLAGKVAIVTGAAGGIGAAIVTRLLAEGCQVVAVDIDAAAAARACPADAVDRLEIVSADVASEAGTQGYVDAALRRFGRIDLFANNAGIFRGGAISEMDMADFDATVAVNLRGVFLGLRAVLRQMAAQRTGGAIVNTASIGPLRPASGCGAYNATKAGVVALTQSAAHENGSLGIRVNAICPGPTDTAMLAAAVAATPPGDAAARRGTMPLARRGQPSEIADLVAFLMSGESSFITGASHVIDGGSVVG
jgi:3-oxoacyl-[acyl-carrier protein] reductase